MSESPLLSVSTSSCLDYLVFNMDINFFSFDHTEKSAEKFPLGFAMPYQPDFHAALILNPGTFEPPPEVHRCWRRMKYTFERFRKECPEVRYMALKDFVRLWLLTYKPAEAMVARLQNKNPMRTVLKIPSRYEDCWVGYSISD